ncbi:prepilin peptidase [Mumia quercus]|uniref:prepilin peptidase n=1 Tax=Mumia quercus TaxID=2976125 RepID=UPI0021D27ECC|nr:A24 family peptidase [Mumia quercus]
MPEPAVAALLAAAVAALGALLAPRVVARLPEPEPVAPDETAADEKGESAVPEHPVTTRPVKIPYAELADRPHLALWLAGASAVLAGALGWQLGLDPALPLWVAFVVLGVTLSYVDWHTRLLPKRLVLPAYPAAVVLALLAAALAADTAVLARAGVGWVAVGGLYLLLWLIAPRGIGYGDVRLSGLLGLCLGALGWAELVVGGYAGFVLGAVGGLALGALGVVDRKAFPFGPFMMLGAWAGAVWGSTLLRAWG